ncbi:MAG: DsbA family oxidoreductase [Flavobacteriales bacterium]|nr:DsbA family oxidoreductase [Flavobacteriales bacterium]
MKVEIWSDVVCPFCYIGKREFEKALLQFEHRAEVEIIWKSFELDPNAPVNNDKDLYDLLSAKYGRSREETLTNVRSVVERADSVGLAFEMDRAIATNSFDAHRLLQYAKSIGKGDAMKERLLKAYFMEGAHIGDHEQLLDLALEIGIDRETVMDLLASAAFTEEVRNDETEAQQLGIRGVPFFVVDRRYGISGAQSNEHFAEVLNKAWEERVPN